MQSLPIFLNVTAKKLVIIGSGKGAMQRLSLLSNTATSIAVIAEQPQARLVQLAKQYPQTQLHRRAWQDSDLDETALIFLTPDTKTEKIQAQTIANKAKLQGIPVNAMDDKDLCDFYVPAIVNRSPLIVAIGSQGTAPVLTIKIKAMIERILPENLGAIANYAMNLRAHIKTSLPADLRRHFWHKFFDTALAHKQTNNNMLNHMVESALQATLAQAKNNKGKLEIITLDSNDADNISLKIHRSLLASDIIVYDGKINKAILQMARRDADFYQSSHISKAKLNSAVKQNKHVVCLKLQPKSTSNQHHDNCLYSTQPSRLQLTNEETL